WVRFGSARPSPAGTGSAVSVEHRINSIGFATNEAQSTGSGGRGPLARCSSLGRSGVGGSGRSKWSFSLDGEHVVRDVGKHPKHRESREAREIGIPVLASKARRKLLVISPTPVAPLLGGASARVRTLL